MTKEEPTRTLSAQVALGGCVMAKLVAASVIDMGAVDLGAWFDGERYSATDTTYKLRGGDFQITFRGEDFEVNRKGHLIDGTVTKATIGDKWDGVSLSGLNIDAADLYRVARTAPLNDDLTFFGNLFTRDDTLTGSGEDDVLRAGSGGDILIGGDGSDDLRGEVGADEFRYLDQVESGFFGVDRILDFSQSEGDKINVRHVADFEFIGYSENEGEASQLRFYFEGGNTYIESDVSGNGVVFFKIRLSGEINLTEGDFVL